MNSFQSSPALPEFFLLNLQFKKNCRSAGSVQKILSGPLSDSPCEIKVNGNIMGSFGQKLIKILIFIPTNDGIRPTNFTTKKGPKSTSNDLKPNNLGFKVKIDSRNHFRPQNLVSNILELI